MDIPMISVCCRASVFLTVLLDNLRADMGRPGGKIARATSICDLEEIKLIWDQPQV